ncbi:iron ABC transporter permease [Aestuariibacter sp. GS-14]|uniref:FecCD family ABC transporter permease n=1 Tax=Aestuariibacter sp. GS-14 TaxID=2590670 RepID=UPI001126B061|nr:iron chelate uptake ABC transporter family permease subunit [Aestuariibacter sp. GS-14]TPV54073.1 iron ABC transporter permease [Aestuariibacter sp. GS-14]
MKQAPAQWLAALFAFMLCAAGLLLFSGWQWDLSVDVNRRILWQLQLPLTITAMITGAALSVSGASLQVVLRNPLADPGIIGISSGASLVAAFVLILAPEALVAHLPYTLPVACFTGALFSTWLIYRLSVRMRGVNTAVILAGIAITTLTSAIMGWLYLFADAQSMRNLTFWIMGSLHQADLWVLAVSAPIIVLSLLVIGRHAGALNVLYTGDITAKSAGVDPEKLKLTIMVACALAVGAAVAIAGSIAFLGLLVPHYLRLLLGYDNRYLLPACAMSGATILLLVALLSEWVAFAALPVSMVTATIGGPLLLFALVKGQLK